MFTGIVQRIGRVVRFERRHEGGSLYFDGGWDTTEVAIGESLSVNGICLTVTSGIGTVLKADVSGETLQRTTLKEMCPGDPINLERALRLADRLGGHLVMGHIDGIGTIREKAREGDSYRFEIAAPEDTLRVLVEKGSVALDGISLTIGRLQSSFFQVFVVPYTFENTTLNVKKVGDPINVETDIIGKYVQRFLSPNKGNVTLETLMKAGFL